MADKTKTKNQDYVKSIDWGTVNVSVSYETSPTRTVWKYSSTSNFSIAVGHMNGDADQGFTGKQITVTLSDGVYTFVQKD